jgi:hypothetical protein
MYVYVKMLSGEILSFATCHDVGDLRYNVSVRLQKDPQSLVFFDDEDRVRDGETYNLIVRLLTYELEYTDGIFSLYTQEGNLVATYTEEPEVFYGEEDQETYYWVRDLNLEAPIGEVFIEAVGLSDEAYEVMSRDILNLFAVVPFEREELAKKFINMNIIGVVL